VSDLEAAIALYDYDLPEDRIAQSPAERRDGSRLLVLHRDSGEIEHREFRDIVQYFRDDDLLVVNDTRVIPARLRARKETGGSVEILLLEPVDDEGRHEWRVLLKPGAAFRSARRIFLEGREDVTIRPVRRDDAVFVLGFEDAEGRPLAHHEVMALSEAHGETPLPPYIRRAPEEHADEDRERYQTVYARDRGSVAAPTAGLHFTEELIAEIESRGVERAAVTLHVGIDTFKPLGAESLANDELHGERVRIADEAAATIRAAREASRRVVAIGTTTARTLESFAQAGFPVPYAERTRIFIRPPYVFRGLDALVTNFHLPRSSLLMMVSALVGREKLLETYREAVDRGYRFYSYGDAMLII